MKRYIKKLLWYLGYELTSIKYKKNPINETYTTRIDLLASLPKGMKIAELGVFRGDFSKLIKTVCMPSSLYLVDLFEGEFGSGDKDGKHYTVLNLNDELDNIRSYFVHEPNVKIYKTSTTEFLSDLSNGYLDMVYIDADHSYYSVLLDLILSRSKVKIGGYICGHDYVVNTETERAVNDFCDLFNLKISKVALDGCPSYCIINS
jgi:hypothetical protein